MIRTFLLVAMIMAAFVRGGEMVHLGAPGQPEWDEFRDAPVKESPFDFVFNAEKNTNDWTLFLKQRDVKVNWSVRLNGKAFTNLFLAEDDLINAWKIPAGALHAGTNTLTVVSSSAKDNIVVGDLRLERGTNIWGGAFDIEVVEGAQAIPCRLTISDTNGFLAPILVEGSKVAVRPGVAYLGTGKAKVRLPLGRYTIYAGRGFEYSVKSERVVSVANRPQVIRFGLTREVETRALISCDTHVHTFTHSRHGDATAEERAITLAGEGIELPIATDHNVNIDPVAPAKATGMDRYYTPVRGVEVTTEHAHFNIFPIDADAPAPNHRISDWPDLMKELRATRGTRVVILNHPRNIHNNFQPFAATNFNATTGENLRGFEFSFDAVEVLNSSALQSDWMLSFKDWMALLNYGYKVTAVGSSDGHDVSRYIIGQGRSYISGDDTDPSRIDVDRVSQSITRGRVLVSMGLLTDIEVDERFRAGDVGVLVRENPKVTVTVRGPGWTAVDKIQLFANGELLREENFEPNFTAGEKKRLEFHFPKGPKDFHLVAIASGPPVEGPFWRIPKPYQPTSTTWKPRVIGATNPIYIDADRDGKYTPPRLQK